MERPVISKKMKAFLDGVDSKDASNEVHTTEG